MEIEGCTGDGDRGMYGRWRWRDVREMEIEGVRERHTWYTKVHFASRTN